MPKSLKVLGYDAGWHSKRNRGVLMLKLEGGGEQKLKTERPAEFATWLGILSHHDGPFLSEDGWLATGPENLEPDEEA